MPRKKKDLSEAPCMQGSPFLNLPKQNDVSDPPAPSGIEDKKEKQSGGARPGAGRPKTVINQAEFEAKLKEGARENKLAEQFGCSIETIRTYCQNTYGKKFTDVRNDFLSVTADGIFKRAIDLAMAGNVVMLIFLLKNLLKFSDDPLKYEKGDNVDDGFAKFASALTNAVTNMPNNAATSTGDDDDDTDTD